MQKYFITTEELDQNLIKGDDVHHIKNVMRFKEGDEFLVSDEHEEYLVKLLAISKEVSFEKIKKIENNSQLPFIVDIYQGYPKSDKLDDICKHSTELGVSKVYAILSKRNVVKLDPSRYQSKIERFNRIMKEASEQSHRNTKASFGGIFKLKDVDFSSYDLLLCPYEESSRENEKSLFKESISNLKKGAKIAVFIGPEGGIDIEEVKYLESVGFKMVGLGPRILRTETASLYVLAAISYESELR